MHRPLMVAHVGSTFAADKEVPMQRKSVSRILMAIGSTVLVLVALGSAASAMDHSADTQSKAQGRCSNGTLLGSYGFALEGVILGPELRFRGVVLQHYDGKGNITQVDHVVINGVPPTEDWTPGYGTYTVNSNCTGSAVLNTPGNPQVNLHFVIVRGGKEIHQVVDSNLVSAVGTKVE
jgi:hypothetical protein